MSEPIHEDEYDALARQFHESIAEGQTIEQTAKALRILAPNVAAERTRVLSAVRERVERMNKYMDSRRSESPYVSRKRVLAILDELAEKGA